MNPESERTKGQIKTLLDTTPSFFLQLVKESRLQHILQGKTRPLSFLALCSFSISEGSHITRSTSTQRDDSDTT